MEHQKGCIIFVCTCDKQVVTAQQLLEMGYCPCGNTSYIGCSVNGCPLYLKELEDENV